MYIALSWSSADFLQNNYIVRMSNSYQQKRMFFGDFCFDLGNTYFDEVKVIHLRHPEDASKNYSLLIYTT